jgi:hypothetical protein
MVLKIIIAIIAFYNQVDMFGGPQYMKHVIPKLVRTLFVTPKEFSLDMKSLYQGPGCVLGSTKLWGKWVRVQFEFANHLVLIFMLPIHGEVG